MKHILTIAALTLTLGVTTAQAQAQQQGKKKQSLHDQYSGQGYGLAGCGLGSIVFGEAPGIIQVIAATLNGFSGTQTFGITSGTSNCGESGKVARAHDFIQVNKVALDNDLARGNGESVAALGEVMGCHNSDFSSSLRKSYSVGASDVQLEQSATQACQL